MRQRHSLALPWGWSPKVEKSFRSKQKQMDQGKIPKVRKDKVDCLVPLRLKQMLTIPAIFITNKLKEKQFLLVSVWLEPLRPTQWQPDQLTGPRRRCKESFQISKFWKWINRVRVTFDPKWSCTPEIYNNFILKQPYNNYKLVHWLNKVAYFKSTQKGRDFELPIFTSSIRSET